MKILKTWAQYYVDLLTRLGIVKFSVLLAACLILLAVVVQVGVTLFLSGEVKNIDLIRSVFFGLLITPWAVYFFSVVVDQLEDSRKRLSRMVGKLQQMREKDHLNTQKLTNTIEQMNIEFEERKKAERERLAAIEELESEIAQRKKAQAELEQRTALLRSFIDSSPDLVYYRNEDGYFSGCNKAMEELTGKSETELIGLTPYDVYTADVADNVVETDKEVFDSNEPLTYEQWLQFPNGRQAFFELSKVPFFNQSGRRLGLLGFGRDITERKKYAETLEKASRDKTTFISTISHELRTPLNGIVGLSRILLDDELSDSQRKYLKTIHVSAVTLGNIFNDIVDLDKLDRKRLDIVKKPLNFNDFISDLHSLAHLQAQQKNLYLSFKQGDGLPEYIDTDGTRLRQVLWNLVSNAVKFTEQGKVEIRVFAEPLERGNYLLRFEIQDTGIGIPAQQLEKIFAMYYQVEGNRHATGTGIGLAVSKQLVTALEGSIEVESKPGIGSTFTVELAVEAPEQYKQLSAVAAKQPKLNLLLVEDVELNVTVAKALLEKLGHSVSVAMTGQAALDMVKAHEYQLILLDINLPDMSGFDVAATLWENYGDSLPPIVALTANLIKDKSEYFERGMDDAISKPICLEAVTGMIGELFTTGPVKLVAQVAYEEDDFSAHLDKEMLRQFMEAVDKETMVTSVDLFEKLMPDYIAVLDSNMIAKDQQGIVSEAHKIKGAAGSVGLKRIREVAQQAQSPELPAWWDNIEDWIEIIKSEYLKDVALLRQWIEQQ